MRMRANNRALAMLRTGHRLCRPLEALLISFASFFLGITLIYFTMVLHGYGECVKRVPSERLHVPVVRKESIIEQGNYLYPQSACECDVWQFVKAYNTEALEGGGSLGMRLICLPLWWPTYRIRNSTLVRMRKRQFWWEVGAPQHHWLTVLHFQYKAQKMLGTMTVIYYN